MDPVLTMSLVNNSLEDGHEVNQHIISTEFPDTGRLVVLEIRRPYGLLSSHRWIIRGYTRMITRMNITQFLVSSYPKQYLGYPVKLVEFTVEAELHSVCQGRSTVPLRPLFRSLNTVSSVLSIAGCLLAPSPSSWDRWGG